MLARHFHFTEWSFCCKNSNNTLWPLHLQGLLQMIQSAVEVQAKLRFCSLWKISQWHLWSLPLLYPECKLRKTKTIIFPAEFSTFAELEATVMQVTIYSCCGEQPRIPSDWTVSCSSTPRWEFCSFDPRHETTALPPGHGLTNFKCSLRWTSTNYHRSHLTDKHLHLISKVFCSSALRFKDTWKATNKSRHCQGPFRASKSDRLYGPVSKYQADIHLPYLGL